MRKTTRPFTIILDDLIRSPDITSTEFRLYTLLLSYCAKAANKDKTCRIPKVVLAGEIGMSVTGLTKALRKLETLKLVTVSYDTPQKPAYTINTSPPETICPDEFKGRFWTKALDYIKAKGGLKLFQRKTNKRPTKEARRTGWPKGRIPGPPPTSDVLTDEVGAQVHQQQSLTDSTHTLECMSSDAEGEPNPPTPVGGTPHSSGGPPSLQCMGSGQTPQLECIPYKSKKEITERIPYGMPLHGESRALARPEGATLCARSAQEEEPENSAIGAVRRFDISISEEALVPESEEQRLERKRRQKERKTGQLDFNMGPKAKRDGGSEVAPKGRKKHQRGAGPPPTGPRSNPDHRSTQEHADDMTKGPQDVSAVPGDAWGLYAHFSKAVRQKYPNARPSNANKKILGRCKQLGRDYDPVRLYEMIQVLVMDYENFGIARVFMKFSGTPVPTFDQFQANAELLSSFVGIGVISPPAVRRSHYADDYAKRKGGSSSTKVEDSGDPIKALRDKYNPTNK